MSIFLTVVVVLYKVRQKTGYRKQKTGYRIQDTGYGSLGTIGDRLVVVVI